MHDVPVAVEAEAGIVRDLPRVPVEIPKRTGIAAVERFGRLARDLGAVQASLLDHLVDLRLRTDVVSQSDPAPARTVVGDPHVWAELLARPQRQDDAVALEERGLLHLE